MDPFTAGAAIAARSIGYHGTAELILAEAMGPEQIACMFACSASKRSGEHLALILLAGSVARYRAKPQGWSGELERRLAREALMRQANGVPVDRLFDKISAQASALAQDC